MDIYFFVVHQGKILLVMYFLGNILGAIYDLLRVFRRLQRTSRLWVDITDIIYWMMATLWIWCVENQVASGQFRILQLFTVALGMILYYSFLSPMVIRILYTPLHFMGKLFAGMYRYTSRRVYQIYAKQREKGRLMKKKHSKSRRNKAKGKVYFFCIGAVMVLALSVQMVRLYQKNQEYVQREEALSNQVQELEKEQADLEQKEKDVQSNEYKEKVARSKMGLLYQNEIVFREK